MPLKILVPPQIKNRQDARAVTGSILLGRLMFSIRRETIEYENPSQRTDILPITFHCLSNYYKINIFLKNISSQKVLGEGL